MSARLLGAKQRKERFQLAENLRSARCSPFVISKALAARMRKLINARARKNKCTARMLAKTIRYSYDLWSRNWLLWLIEIIDCWFRIMVAMVRKPIEYQDWRLLGSKNRSVSEIDHPEHLPPGGGGGYSIYPWVGGAAWPLISWPWQKNRWFSYSVQDKIPIYDTLFTPNLRKCPAEKLSKIFVRALFLMKTPQTIYQ